MLTRTENWRGVKDLASKRSLLETFLAVNVDHVIKKTGSTTVDKYSYPCNRSWRPIGL
jgi:hypothetical protein